MATQVLMPSLSPEMKFGKLTRWLKREGDYVEAGDVLAEIETEKATMEVEAVESGVLERILAPEGADKVAVNAPIAIIVPAEARPETPAGSAAPAPAEEEAFAPLHISVREALREALAEEMRRDPSVFVLGEEVGEAQGAPKVTQGLLQEFGARRVVDAPISEHAFAGLGVGAAMAGLRPVIEFMSFNFALQAMDHIVNSAAKTLYMSGGALNIPIVFRGPNGARARVGAQHAQDFSAWFAHIPGLKVVAPYSAADAKGLLKAAIRDPNPVIFLEHEKLYGQSFPAPREKDHLVPIGAANIARAGREITIVAYSHGVGLALKAAERLAEEEIEAEVIDLRTLRPLDMATILGSVAKTGRCVLVDEGWPQGGIAAEISARLMEEAFDDLDAPVARVTGRDIPMPYAANLERLSLPSEADIVAATRKALYLKL
ncbi:pyruvate dehydrogenase complex E1 component subunit beta [Rhodoblastus acidophilus]|uniref:Pyruvate dehydrogenase E1 component subunit beta n=1 Tax=Candidatus Rhodoblastus alkanivorans TaxID=2954117 RepID=A0ABS9Z686_9HYPH|nr:pyruvate dehydrogenase complex E1 component subunit beta [Candidatus Rhodoblastus alkanivorans]MCI4679189.1 pyruvate dehydrogenase complex E1 component subunit beta [Candidatus Rhodoblastus alkanivorans]MCI4683185.1 pyruvate dehydrogenase complex E1 component subunit beta [Candidatus Rhodoblastus alkanivorans]MDI4640497.1 pyruvate dehydrogenase complex E1 component subunit beta [Rhodoblastus acidophilus]